MSEEDYKSPWEIEHERQVARAEAEQQAAEKHERAQFLRGLKLTHRSDKTLHQLTENQSEEKSSKKQKRPSAAEERAAVRNEKQQTKTLKKPSRFQKSAPILKRIWPLIVVFLLIIMGSLYSLSPLNHVGSFAVTGNQTVSNEQLAQSTNIPTKETIFQLYFDRAKIESRVVNSSPHIKAATLTIAFPNKVTLSVEEYKAIGYVQQKSKNYSLLSNGVILKDKAVSASKLGAHPLLLKNFTDSETREFTAAYSTLKSDVQSLIQTVTLTPTQSTSDFITLAMSDGNQVKVPLSQMGEKLPYYPSIAKNLTAPETVDMEVGIFSAPTPDYNKTFSGDVPKTSSKSSSTSSSASTTPSS